MKTFQKTYLTEDKKKRFYSILRNEKKKKTIFLGILNISKLNRYIYKNYF